MEAAAQFASSGTHTPSDEVKEMDEVKMINSGMLDVVESHLSPDSSTLWVLVWALPGMARSKMADRLRIVTRTLIVLTVFVQLVVPIFLVVENWPADHNVCPKVAPLHLRLTASALITVLWLALQGTRDEVRVLRYLRHIFARKIRAEPAFRAAYLKAGVWANSLCSVLVMTGACRLLHRCTRLLERLVG